MEAIFGLRARQSGTLTLNGKRYAPRRAADAIRAGIGFVAEDRRVQGIVPDFSVRENLLLAIGRHRSSATPSFRLVLITVKSSATRVEPSCVRRHHQPHLRRADRRGKRNPAVDPAVAGHVGLCHPLRAVPRLHRERRISGPSGKDAKPTPASDTASFRGNQIPFLLIGNLCNQKAHPILTLRRRCRTSVNYILAHGGTIRKMIDTYVNLRIQI